MSSTKNFKEKYPHKYSYDYSTYLCEHEADKFDEWWDPKRFDWSASKLLCKYAPSKFNIWWDKNKFDWDRGSRYLCEYLSDKFDIWWNPVMFNWTDSDYLKKYLPDKRDVWDSPEALDTESLNVGKIFFVGMILGFIGMLASTVLSIFVLTFPLKTVEKTMVILIGLYILFVVTIIVVSNKKR